MKIALINGSPKFKNSASGSLLEDVGNYIGNRAEISYVEIHTNVLSSEMTKKLFSTDIWVFAFPLYVDGIPSHLLSVLIQLEKCKFKKMKIKVYSIVNCGFYEGIQNELALEVIKNWCFKIGYKWCGGIGIGGGGLVMLSKIQYKGKLRVGIDNLLSMFATNLINGKVLKNNYISVDLPRWLYKLGGQWNWRRMIKANGGKTKDLGRKLY